MPTLLDFYRNQSPNTSGYTLAQIHAFSLEDLESHHDFIQWLFPLEVPSPVNPEAPTLTPRDAALFQTDPALRQALLHSLDLMLHFYGLERTPTHIARTPAFPARAKIWLSPNNHNHLRLTRILHSLTLCGQHQQASALLTALTAIAQDFPAAITPRTQSFWSSSTLQHPNDSPN